MAKLKTARKRRRTQDYTSTNNLTQNYDPPPYEDVIRTVTDPPSYNITSDEATATDSGAGEGGKLSSNCTGEDDEKRKMMLMMMMMKNGQSHGHCCGGGCNKKYRNDHIALTPQKLPPEVDLNQVDNNYCGVGQPLKVALPPPKSTKDPLRKNVVNHVHNCSVTIESPVSSSTATYSHRISSYSNQSSSSSNNDFELPCNRPDCSGDIPIAYHDDMVFMNNHLEMNDEDYYIEMDEQDGQHDDILEGATACCPAVIPSLSENGICDNNISPSYSGAVYSSANDVASATPNAAIVLNGVVIDDNDDEDYENDDCLPSGNLFSEIDSFLYADGGSGSCSPQDNVIGTGLVVSDNAYQCHNNSVKLRTKNPESCTNDNRHSSDNSECCNAMRLPANINMATQQCELISAEPEAVRLLQW